MTEEKDYVGDLRILMNRDMIDSKRFLEGLDIVSAEYKKKSTKK